MSGLRVVLLTISSWLASSNSPLSSQRHQRVHAVGGSYLAKVSSAAEKKGRPVPLGNTVPFSPAPLEKRERYDYVPPNIRVSSPSQKRPYLRVSHSPQTQPSLAPSYVASTSALPIVDIFYIFADLPKSAMFVHSQYYWVLPTVAAMIANTNKSNTSPDSEVRIHVLSDSIEVLEKASTLGFYSYDLVPHIDKHNRFLNRVGRTVNNTASELGFFRWKVLNHIVTDWNSQGAASLIRRVMVMDGEVLLTVNAAALYDRAVALALNDAGTSAQKNPVAPEAIYLTDSVMLYSPQGLNAFDAYIDQWFNGCKRDELHRKSVGTHDRPWSDVILFKHFANASTPATLRVTWFDNLVPNAPLVQKHTQALGCEPLPYYDNPYGVHVRVNGLPYQLRNQPLQGNQTHQDPKIHDIHIVGPGQHYPYCFMGFVHKHVKGLLYAYGRALEILRGGEEAHNPSALDPLAGDLLLSPEKSREVYYIHSHSTRSFIANKEEFKHLFLARDQVIGRVPIGIIEAFRPLPLRCPWSEGEVISFNTGRTIYFVDKGSVLRPLVSQEVLKRFNKSITDVKIYKDYGGPISDSIPIGPAVDIQDKR